MKKFIIYFGFALSSFFSINAQILQYENFDDLFIGNVGSDYRGNAPGQGTFLTFADNGAVPTTTTNAGNSNFQIVSSGNNFTKGVQLQGPNGNKGGMYMWKNGFLAAFSARTPGNNIIEAEVDFFTGPPTTSTGFTGIYLVSNQNTIINGFIFTNNTKLLRGAAVLNNMGSIGTYPINLAAGGLILNANTWYRLGFGYNINTGQPTWRINTDTTSSSIQSSNWARPPFTPFEIDFVSEVGTGSTNSDSFSGIFDNFVVRATATDTLLQNDTFNVATTNFSVSPNPANDLITISNSDNVIVNSISIIDLNGRVVKQNSYSNVTNVLVNISDLDSGVYMMNIVSEKGNSHKKIIKN